MRRSWRDWDVELLSSLVLLLSPKALGDGQNDFEELLLLRLVIVWELKRPWTGSMALKN